MSCDSFHNRSNVIAANQTIVDTAQQYITLAKDSSQNIAISEKDSLVDSIGMLDSTAVIVHAQSSPEALVAYALTLEGVPYIYGEQDPEKGFDNSSYVNYVFQHFQIEVPRHTTEFAKTGKQIPMASAGPGDLILFSSSETVKNTVNHVGIITTEKGKPISFIHATSGKRKGVVVTNMNSYYQKRIIAVKTLFQ
ncbi:MAG: C40 family peptidase [Pelobium sp.]